MKPLISILATTALVWTTAVATAQTPAATVDGYLREAKTAPAPTGRDFLRLCIPPPAGPQGAGGSGRGGAPRVPAKETWYAEPAKVADNLYFVGTKAHSAWVVASSEAITIIEALFERRDPLRHEEVRSRSWQG